MAAMFYVVLIIIVLAIAWWRYQGLLHNKRERLIDSYRFPEGVKKRLVEKYPHLDEQQADLVMAGLREYLKICHQAGREMVSMPSQAVDVAWHEFILFTREYEYFCRRAIGRFLHHTPAEAMKSPILAQEGIKRAWRISCQREGIDATIPKQLPLLFAIDASLKIEDGFHYTLDCVAAGKNAAGGAAAAYCASHIGCASGCAGDAGGADDAGASDDVGCGGGCGGD